MTFREDCKITVLDESDLRSDFDFRTHIEDIITSDFKEGISGFIHQSHVGILNLRGKTRIIKNRYALDEIVN